MPKYLAKATYTAEGAKGLMKEGGSGRRAAVQKVVETLGGKLEMFYYAYGPDDAYVVVDVPDPNAAVALSLAVNASGAVRLALVPLLAPEDIDAACKKSPTYRAPGA